MQGQTGGAEDLMTQAAMTSGRDELCFYVKKTMLVILGISNAAGGKVRSISPAHCSPDAGYKLFSAFGAANLFRIQSLPFCGSNLVMAMRTFHV